MQFSCDLKGWCNLLLCGDFFFTMWPRDLTYHVTLVLYTLIFPQTHDVINIYCNEKKIAYLKDRYTYYIGREYIFFITRKINNVRYLWIFLLSMLTLIFFIPKYHLGNLMVSSVIWKRHTIHKCMMKVSIVLVFFLI